MDIAEGMASDIITAGTALAGLLLVFIGNAVSDFQGYDAETSDLVRSRYKRKAGFALAGFGLSLLSVLLAFVDKICCLPIALAGALILLLLSIIATAISGFTLAREIW
jgi:hypothetical protein